jgi:hypothetical protein
MSERTRRVAWVVLALALATVPFLVSDFVPCVDLPQHLGQLRLFSEAWDDPTGSLEVRWWTPYWLVYAFLAVPWLLLPPVLAGKVALLILVWVQVAMIHFVAARFERSAAGAMLASAFVFSQSFYWGFLNFAFGWIVFIGWMLLLRGFSPAEKVAWRAAPVFLAAAAGLYFAHALWFGAGIAYLGIDAWLARRPWSELRWRLLGVLPVVTTAGTWFTLYRGTVEDPVPHWLISPLERLTPTFFGPAGLGALRGPFEGLILVVAGLWIVVSLVANRRQRWWGCEPRLLSLGALLLAFYLALPNEYVNAIQFSDRWLPFAWIVLLLAVGSPPGRPRVRRLIPALLFASFMLVTATAWLRFERVELTGLEDSLAALPPEPKVLGLSYLKRSRYVIGRPFIQVYSWSYVLQGGGLNFSFGDLPTSLVVYTSDEANAWTEGLEWYPKWVRRSDFEHFDFALVQGDAAAHAKMQSLGVLEPVTSQGRWRLYRVQWVFPLVSMR